MMKKKQPKEISATAENVLASGKDSIPQPSVAPRPRGAINVSPIPKTPTPQTRRVKKLQSRFRSPLKRRTEELTDPQSRSRPPSKQQTDESTAPKSDLQPPSKQQTYELTAPNEHVKLETTQREQVENESQEHFDQLELLLEEQRVGLTTANEQHQRNIMVPNTIRSMNCLKSLKNLLF